MEKTDHVAAHEVIRRALDTWGAGGTLRVEVDRLLDVLLAERQQLEADHAHAWQSWKDGEAWREQVRGENVQLREALEEIAYAHIYNAQGIAQAALAAVREPSLPPHDHTIEPGEINRRGCRRCQLDSVAGEPSQDRETRCPESSL